MEYVLAPYGGAGLVVAFMAAFFLFNYVISYVFAKDYHKTKSAYLVANRDLGLWQASLSISASWIWAPAMFISASKAYTEGWVALFYFLGANTLALLTFALMVNKIVEKWPNGFTLSDFMGVQHSNRVRKAYWVTLIGLTIGAFATQLFAGAKFIQIISGMDYFYATVMLAVVPLAYCIFFGFKSSIITDLTKMVILLVISVGLVSMLLSTSGVESLVNGINGVSGEYVSLFDAKGWHVFATFGLATVIGLMSAPFGDQALWQRAFAIKDPKVRRNSFIVGTGFFLVVPFCMAMVGMMAAGAGFETAQAGFVNLMYIIDQLPIWAVMLFGVMVLAGITSILDSKLSAMSSIAGHDIAIAIYKTPSDAQSIMVGKASMVILAVAAVAIANIPGVTLVHLFLTYGALRASTLLPTMIVMLTGKSLNEAGVFYGIICSVLIGVPVLAYGAFTSQPWFTVIGASSAVLLSGVIAWSWTAITKTANPLVLHSSSMQAS